MITLYSGGGAGDFEFLSQALPDDDLDTLLFNVSQFLAARGEIEAVGYLATLKFELSEATNHFNDEFVVLHASIPLNQYLFFDEAVERREFRQIFENIASTVNKISDFYVRFVVCRLDQSQPPDKWREDLSSTVAALGSNQGLFTYRNNAKIVHAGLHFRSKTEVRIFDVLVKRGVLVFPLPVAVMGRAGVYKEPDFVVMHMGKTGILEIHGDKWHPPESAAQEHERRREFTRLGISIYEIFGAERCWNDPESVVAEFLQAFARH